MHRRLIAGVTVSLSALTAAAAMALPSPTGAAPVHNDGLTITASPNPIAAGEGVLIYGQLTGSNVADQRVILYHRIDPRASSPRSA